MAQIKILDKKPMFKIKKNAEQLREYDNQMVRGIFRYDEVPTGILVFSYRKYKKDPIKNYTLEDGNTYTLPRGVAKHLASTGGYPVHEYQTNADGRPVVRIGRKKRRYSFESLAFFDDIEEEITSNESSLYTVEKL